MSAPTQNGQPPAQPQGPPPLPDGTAPVDPQLVTNALLNAVQQCAVGAAAASGQDAKDYMTAALNGAQAIVILDPTLSQGGTPLQHDMAIEGLRGQTQENIASTQAAASITQERIRGDHALRAARERAAAPTPAKRKTATIRRDEFGRMQSASVSES